MPQGSNERPRRGHRPVVEFVLVARRANPLSEQLAKVLATPELRATFVKDGLCELHFKVNGQLLWSVDALRVETARLAMQQDIAKQAAEQGISQFDRMVGDLSRRLRWTNDEALALAISFVFPPPYAIERIGAVWLAPVQRGPRRALHQTIWVNRMALAWQRVTGQVPGLSNSRFVGAVEVSAPYIGLRTARGKPIVDMEKFLRAERRKIVSERFQFQPHRTQKGHSELVLTTPARLVQGDERN